MKQRIVWLSCAAALAASGCEGEQGRAGEDGGAGPAGPSTGPAGGHLAGTYPNPSIATGVIDEAHLSADLLDGSPQLPTLRTLGTGMNQAASGADARLSDARMPLPGSVVSASVDASLVDAASNVASLRTLGAGASQAAAGDDARLTDARTPTGTASGALDGTYPNPSLAAGAITSTTHFAANSIPAGRVTPVAGQTFSGSASAPVWESGTPATFDTHGCLSADGTAFEFGAGGCIPGIYRVTASLGLSNVAGTNGAAAFLMHSTHGILVGASMPQNGQAKPVLVDLVALAAGESVSVLVSPGLSSDYVFGAPSSFTIEWVAPLP